MPIEMFDTLDDTFTFGHAWAGAECDGVAFFTTTNFCMWFMGITPGSATVNKDFELAGDICPVGWGNGYDDISPFVCFHYFKDIVVLEAFSCFMAFSATLAEVDSIVINAGTFYAVTFL